MAHSHKVSLHARMLARGAALVALGVLVGGTALAQTGGTAPSAIPHPEVVSGPDLRPDLFVPMTPCRLIDTRSGANTVGPRGYPMTAQETYNRVVVGSPGNCLIPLTATALALNVTVLHGTAKSFLTIFPADASRPIASSLNWTAGQAATPNAVIGVLAGGSKTLAFYNDAGTVDIIVDVAGYYRPEDEIGGPHAFGHVSSANVLANTKNVVGITHVSPGNNCIEFDSTVALTALMVTMDFTDDGTSVSGVAWAEVAGTCGTHGLNVVTLQKNFSSATATFVGGGYYFTLA